MTWSYTDPSASQKDEVRWLVGDTNQAAQIVSDEEVLYALAKSASVFHAAAQVARAIAAKFARNVQTSVSSLSFANQQKHQQYIDLAKELESRAAHYVGPLFKGTKVSDREEYRGDSDAVQPIFEHGMHDYGGDTTGESDLR